MSELEADDLGFGGDEELPDVTALLTMVREETYDVPALAMMLGLSESHARLLLSTVAAEEQMP